LPQKNYTASLLQLVNAVYSENHTEDKNALLARQVQIFNVTAGNISNNHCAVKG
jgi:hypothetical protein